MTSGKPDSIRPTAALGFSATAHFYTHVIMLLYPTVVLVLDDVFDWTYGELLELLLPGYVLFGLAALPAGWLGDRWSTRGMMAVFYFGTGSATVLTGFANSPLAIGIGLTFMGLFASIYHPVGTSFVVRHATNRGRALGLNGVFGTSGVALAAVIAGALTDSFGWRMAFFVPGAICLATGVAFLTMTAPDGQRGGEDGRSGETFSIDRATAMRALGLLGVTILFAGFIAQAFLVGLPKVFEQRVAIESLSERSSLISVALLIGASGQLIGGYLADRFAIKNVYIAMQCLLLPVLISAAWLYGMPLIVAAVMIQLFMTSALPAENCLVARFCPPDRHGLAYGGKFVMGLGISSLAVPMVGWIHDTTGSFYWYFLAMACCSCLILAVALFLPGERAIAQRAVAPAPGAAE